MASTGTIHVGRADHGVMPLSHRLWTFAVTFFFARVCGTFTHSWSFLTCFLNKSLDYMLGPTQSTANWLMCAKSNWLAFIRRSYGICLKGFNKLKSSKSIFIIIIYIIHIRYLGTVHTWCLVLYLGFFVFFDFKINTKYLLKYVIK